MVLVQIIGQDIQIAVGQTSWDLDTAVRNLNLGRRLGPGLGSCVLRVRLFVVSSFRRFHCGRRWHQHQHLHYPRTSRSTTQCRISFPEFFFRKFCWVFILFDGGRGMMEMMGSKSFDFGFGACGVGALCFVA